MQFATQLLDWFSSTGIWGTATQRADDPATAMHHQAQVEGVSGGRVKTWRRLSNSSVKLHWTGPIRFDTGGLLIGAATCLGVLTKPLPTASEASSQPMNGFCCHSLFSSSCRRRCCSSTRVWSLLPLSICFVFFGLLGFCFYHSSEKRRKKKLIGSRVRGRLGLTLAACFLWRLPSCMRRIRAGRRLSTCSCSSAFIKYISLFMFATDPLEQDGCAAGRCITGCFSAAVSRPKCADLR